MRHKYILSLDQGTTGTRAVIFNAEGKIVSWDYKEIKQYYPKPGWVEHDPDEIWGSCNNVIRNALARGRINPKNIASVGITNQRETSVLWDRASSKPAHRAVVWQCRRSSEICNGLKKAGLESFFKERTGLVIDPYFSGTKIKWLLDNINGVKRRAQRGNLCFGTIDSWLIWNLTSGKVHATDITNASRTLMFNIRKLRWDDDILNILKIPKGILPEAYPSGHIFGRTSDKNGCLPAGLPISGIMGDQQAALYGQGCWDAGQIKNTYGTGCFIMLNTGRQFVSSNKGLITTLACDLGGRPIFALEGSVFIAGAVVQWLRDGLRVIKNSSQTERMANSVKDSQGVYFVSAFTGLGAPYWDSDARGLITGITRGTTVNHIVRASLEAIAYQTKDVFDIMVKCYGKRIKELKVDGGACRNNFLLQFQADMLNILILRPAIIETTAQGAAHLAGFTIGLWDKEDLKKMQRIAQTFYPHMKEEARDRLYKGWLKAVSRSR